VRVNIGELLADRRAVRVVGFSERVESPAEDITLVDPVAGDLSLISTGRTVCLTGRVHTVLSLVCSACLRPFQQPLEFVIDEEFGRAPASSGRPACARQGTLPERPVPARGGQAGRGGQADGGTARGEPALGPLDFVVPVGPDEVVDLSEIIRQQLVLALPIAPRCREECRGLCPSCGADLNAGRCACPGADIDPRLQTLQQWPPVSRSRPARERK
jgi:uncharacterized protein